MAADRFLQKDGLLVEAAAAPRQEHRQDGHRQALQKGRQAYQLCEVVVRRAAGGRRYFLHEHPSGASSWRLKASCGIVCATRGTPPASP